MVTKGSRRRQNPHRSTTINALQRAKTRISGLIGSIFGVSTAAGVGEAVGTPAISGKSSALAADLLGLIFNAAGITGIADNAAIAPATNLYVSFHTGDPGETGNQNTSECAYSGYARVGVARSGAGWAVTANVVSPAADVVFPRATAGSEVITHFSIGTDPSGAGKILYYGTVTPNISIFPGVRPKLTTASTITED